MCRLCFPWNRVSQAAWSTASAVGRTRALPACLRPLTMLVKLPCVITLWHTPICGTLCHFDWARALDTQLPHFTSPQLSCNTTFASDCCVFLKRGSGTARCGGPSAPPLRGGAVGRFPAIRALSTCSSLTSVASLLCQQSANNANRLLLLLPTQWMPQ